MILLPCPLHKHLLSLRRRPGTTQLVIHYLFSKDSTTYVRGAQVTMKSCGSHQIQKMSLESPPFSSSIPPGPADKAASQATRWHILAMQSK